MAWQSEEEVVDHLPALKASCAKHCPAQKKEYNDIASRAKIRYSYREATSWSVLVLDKSTMSEEEVVDHLPALKASCAKHCPAQKKEYNACKQRIAKLGEGDCEAWFFDFLHCVDHCVAPQAFKKLK
eukprot:CAMPEP_0172573072 /NCGR_PEP_ID=MMETSP1067-20121228/136004_1 /TAXON_ID=265564 ORGANISM="Thalassiosira punctigera, Strain Tpunct2005C2" /NCGR_SAMPLE_ID=MMETSP1067 /ASSEMBLY_ACC=CAM_ASM_000444 /LENGTH=126 /DNA_ID=CAMNT_0013365669 /DNA_START=443 /DNA_END=823 /DNA_ORIENTATION=-